MRIGPRSRAGGSSPTGTTRGDGNSRRYLLRRLAVAAFALWVTTSLVFFAIHLGPRDPAEMSVHETTADEGDAEALEAKKERFGLTRPLAVQYVDYLGDMATLDFGESFTARESGGIPRQEPITDVNRLLTEKLLPRTAWLWGWSLVVAALLGLPLGLALGYSDASWTASSARVSGALLKAMAVFVLLTALRTTLSYSHDLLFGFTWRTFLVELEMLQGTIELGNLHRPVEFGRALKRVLPGAVAIGVALAAPFVRVGERAVASAREAQRANLRDANGLRRRERVRRVLHEASVPLASMLSSSVALLVGATLFVEIHMEYRGVGQTFVDAVGHGDYTTAQAIAVVFVLVVVAARLLESVLLVALVGAPEDRSTAASRYWTAASDAWGAWERPRPERLVGVRRFSTTDALGRLRATPRPAAAWALAGLVLLALEVGAVLDAVALLPHVPSLPEVPTLLSRDVVPNMGHRTPDGGWAKTAFGLSPAVAWALRVGLVFAYATAWAAWAWVGYRLYANVYRESKLTGVDEAFARFRGSSWARFGAVVVFVFVVTATFAPALGPTTLDRNGADPGQDARVEYLEDGEVRESSVAVANMYTESRGREDAHVGPLSYDQYSRYHPLGTTYGGGDLLTSMLSGVRTYALVGAVTAFVASGLALAGGLLSVTRGGVLDDVGSLGVDVLGVLPTLPFAFLFVEQFEPWMPNETVGSTVMAATFGVLAVPLLWRTLREPLEAATAASWTTAARGFGEGTTDRVRRHVLGRVAARTTSYAVLAALGGMIAHTTVSALWGGSVHYVRAGLGPIVTPRLATMSGHVDVYPLLATLLLFVGLYAFADGVRLAAHPGASEGVAAPGEAAATGESG